MFVSLFLLSACFWWDEESSKIWENQGLTSEDQSIQEEKTRYILALWDSLTAGYTLPIEDSYPSQLEVLLQDNWYNYKLINAWVSGNTSAQALERLDLYLEDEEEIPELAIVVIWWNDGLRWQSIDEIEKNLTEITKALQEKWTTVIIGWMQIPPNRWFRYFNDFKWVYKKVAKATDAERIPFFLDDVATKWVYNLPDGIHPNKDGYEIISKNIFEFLKKNKLITND